MCSEIRQLLSSIQEVLPEAENKYGHSLQLQDWVGNLKIAAFYAEAMLEELSVEEALWQRKRKVCRLFRAFVRLTYRWRMRDELRVVVRQLQDVIGLDWVGLLRNIPAEIGETHEAAGAVPLIGRDDEKGELLRHLLHGGMKRNIPVLTVCGSAGIGKTALVQEVCSESKVNCHFDIIIWVNASPPFDVNRMARDIIASLTKGGDTEEENVVEEQLFVRMGKLLDGTKRYVFILDDLAVHDLDRQVWLRFCSFLEGGATGSKILLTTRDSKGISYKESPTFALQGPTLEDSIDLLLKTAFKGGVDEIIDPLKHQIAEEVASECNGNPLNIRAVGNYLSLQHDASDWPSLRHQDDYSVLSAYGHLVPMVKGYNHLPPRIKQCFGLCSLFPRGYAIDRQTLAELWIALGYIQSSNKEHQPLEDITEDYFDRLLREELFQVKKFDTFGKVRSIVLHPNAVDLARSVTGWECRERSFEGYSLERAQCISLSDPVICISFNHSRVGPQTLLHFVNDPSGCNGMSYDFCPDLKIVRVLDLHQMNVETVPEFVWKQKLLRYLDLSDSRIIETLPPAITDLVNLQTLKLSGCWALKELPPDMRKLVALRHLYIDGCRRLCLMPKGLGDMKFLSILTDFILPQDDSSSVRSANLADLCKLNDLRGSLRITNLGYSEEAIEIQGLLDEKGSLESLELIFRNLRVDTVLLDKLRPHPNLKGLKIHNYGGTLFPEWMSWPLTYLPNLVEIALIGCENCKYLPELDKLRHLKSLTVQGLPNLLRMVSGPGLRSPDVANNAQPFGELSSLCIRDCPKLDFLPLIPHLAKLSLVNVSEQLFGHPFWVASSLRTLRLENIELLDHIPEEWLRDLTSLEDFTSGVALN